MGDDNYRVDINGKGRTCDINILKKLDKHEEPVKTNAMVWELVTSSVLETEESGAVETVNDDDLLILLHHKSLEGHEDVHYGPQINKRSEATSQCFNIQILKDVVDLPRTTDLVRHYINLTTERPICCKPYTIPINVRGSSLCKDIFDMLDMKIIGESLSPYASPVVIVRKPDRTNIICVEYV